MPGQQVKIPILWKKGTFLRRLPCIGYPTEISLFIPSGQDSQNSADLVLTDYLSTLFEMPPGRGSNILLHTRVTGIQSPNIRPTATSGM